MLIYKLTESTLYINEQPHAYNQRAHFPITIEGSIGHVQNISLSRFNNLTSSPANLTNVPQCPLRFTRSVDIGSAATTPQFNSILGFPSCNSHFEKIIKQKSKTQELILVRIVLGK
ncbi:hypothetical protein CIPAW_01G215200 [Carya illinoinensis]|uniref:Uncharacterized protein n=1 Tax=Carya illinoinensis TaxID=32201 RepID=A0A8T1RQ72_CARIL|nr:hypothetical protein CIPAW_01G215200 [Carya illinoinensis]